MVIPPFSFKEKSFSFLGISRNDVRQGLTFCASTETRTLHILCAEAVTRVLVPGTSSCIPFMLARRHISKRPLAPNRKPKVGSFRRSESVVFRKILTLPETQKGDNDRCDCVSAANASVQVDPEGHFMRRLAA